MTDCHANAERNSEIARRFFVAIDELDRDTLNTLYAPDFELEYPGNAKPLDREAHWRLITSYHSAFSDLEHRPDILTAQADRVVVRGTILGTNDGALLGHPATGRRADIQFMTMMTFRDERISRLFSLIDGDRLRAQLGILHVLHAEE